MNVEEQKQEDQSKIKSNTKFDGLFGEEDDDGVQKDDRTAETENMPNSLFQMSSNYFGGSLNHEEEPVELNRYNEVV